MLASAISWNQKFSLPSFETVSDKTYENPKLFQFYVSSDDIESSGQLAQGHGVSNNKVVCRTLNNAHDSVIHRIHKNVGRLILP
jgi:hypothetical protein